MPKAKRTGAYVPTTRDLAMYQAYQAGESVQAIADAFALTRGGVYHIFRRCDWKVRPVSLRSPEHYRAWAIWHRKEVVRLRALANYIETRPGLTVPARLLTRTTSPA